MGNEEPIMKKICVVSFDEKINNFHTYKPNKDHFKIREIPRIGEKITYSIGEYMHIADVIDVVHESMIGGGADIFIANERRYSDYIEELALKWNPNL